MGRDLSLSDRSARYASLLACAHWQTIKMPGPGVTIIEVAQRYMVCVLIDVTNPSIGVGLPFPTLPRGSGSVHQGAQDSFSCLKASGSSASSSSFLLLLPPGAIFTSGWLAERDDVRYYVKPPYSEGAGALATSG